MKSVVILSLVTFGLIFGGVVLLSQKMPYGAPAPSPIELELTPEDHVAAERLMQDLELERDRIQREKEQTLVLRQTMDVQEKVIQQATADLQGQITKLQDEKRQYDEARDQSVRKLAKMYENMKPVEAAPILSALDVETVLEVLKRMKERPAAKILAQLEPGLAAQISMRMSLKGEL
jgi:flagellar motility protein MotE (MotC chaperone)